MPAPIDVQVGRVRNRWKAAYAEAALNLSERYQTITERNARHHTYPPGHQLSGAPAEHRPNPGEPNLASSQKEVVDNLDHSAPLRTMIIAPSYSARSENGNNYMLAVGVFRKTRSKSIF